MMQLRFHLMSPFSGRLPFTGGPLRAAFLSLLRQADAELSSQVHDASEVRTYSLDPFPFDKRFMTLFEEGEEYTFGVNLLNSEHYARAIRQLVIANRTDIRLYHHVFPVRRIDLEQVNPETAMASWVEEFKRAKGESVVVTMHFLTPTQLSVYGSEMGCLLPQPERVFPALLRVWNRINQATSLERVSDYRDWVEKNVSVSYHRIHTETVPLGRGRDFVGFVGKVVYAVGDRDSPFAALTGGLAKFAEISNIGKNRTAGLGRVRTVLEVGTERRGHNTRRGEFVSRTGRRETKDSEALQA
ncbi:MAG: CRISPR system precrRNA processing endoribonuclease RAMP protein Cas6 [Candidatus Thorarchaeota archaeon]